MKIEAISKEVLKSVKELLVANDTILESGDDVAVDYDQENLDLVGQFGDDDDDDADYVPPEGFNEDDDDYDFEDADDDDPDYQELEVFSINFLIIFL